MTDMQKLRHNENIKEHCNHAPNDSYVTGFQIQMLKLICAWIFGKLIYDLYRIDRRQKKAFMYKV